MSSHHYLAYYRQLLTELEQCYEIPNDPAIKQLLSGMAYLLGIQQDYLKHYMAEYSQPKLQKIAPALMQPYPCRGIIQCQVNTTENIEVPANTELVTYHQGEKLRFKTLNHFVGLPIKISQVHYVENDRQSHSIILSFECLGELCLKKLSTENLVFYIDDKLQGKELAYALLNNARSIQLVVNNNVAIPCERFFQRFAIESYGDTEINQCVRLVQDYCFFTEVFNYIKLPLPRKLESYSTTKEFKLVINMRMENYHFNFVNNNTFRLNCVPVINSYAQSAEPIKLDQRQLLYPLVGCYAKDDFDFIALHKAQLIDDFEQRDVTDQLQIFHRSHQGKMTPHMLVDPREFSSTAILSLLIEACDKHKPKQLQTSDSFSINDASLNQNVIITPVTEVTDYYVGQVEKQDDILLKKLCYTTKIWDLLQYLFSRLGSYSLNDEYDQFNEAVLHEPQGGYVYQVIHYQLRSPLIDKALLPNCYFLTAILHHLFFLLRPLNTKIKTTLNCYQVKRSFEWYD